VAQPDLFRSEPSPLPSEVRDDDPFGADITAQILAERRKNQQEQPAHANVGRWAGKPQKARAKQVNHNERAERYITKTLGLKAANVQYKMVVGGGIVRSCDYLGLFDWEGTDPSEPRHLFQVTSLNGKSSHLHKMTDDTEVVRDSKTTRLKALRYRMSLGDACHLLLFEQKGGKGSPWVPTDIIFTEELIQQVISRKRPTTTKPRKRRNVYR
jgi:hypothetical protein